jgi:UDP-N-acetyl-D-galactosamine dehydrogenase
VASSKVLVMGLTFKENCPDLRNTRVIDVIRELEDFGCSVDVTDCWADNDEAEHEYGIALVNSPKAGDYDALFFAVPHREYAAKSSKELRAYLKDNGVLFDLKGVCHWAKRIFGCKYKFCTECDLKAGQLDWLFY